MIRIAKQIGLLLMVCLGAALPVGGQESWKSVMEKDGITVYARPAEGSPLDQFKGVMVVKASIETCVALLRDVPEQPKWMGDCRDSRLLKTIDKNHIVVYNVLKAPWPLANRDLQIDTVFEENRKEGRVVVRMKACPEEIIPVTRYVRIKDMQAQCILEKIDAVTTRVIYINLVNPVVPAAMGNMFMKNNTSKTLSGFRKMVDLKKYQQ